MEYKFSIILPVWNEASLINRAIDNIFGLSPAGDFEIIVVDGSDSGETIRAIQRKDIKAILSQKGRSIQMNAGASHARGGILFFLHADTTLPRNAFTAISSLMEKGDSVAGAFDLSVESDGLAFRIIERAASLRSRVTRVPYGDQAIFIRKDYFHAIGGFREMPLMEDVDLMRRIKKRGDRIHIIPEQVKTSPRRWEEEGILYCTLRNWTIITLYLLGVSPERLVKFYK